MSSSVACFKLNLLGPFHFATAAGERIEITSRKGMALIAMLAMSKGGERSRVWLQDRLWRERRSSAAAATSLRQELANLRKALNRHSGELLICERERIRLALDLIDVDALDAARDCDTDREFLEGFDLAKQPAFQDWLNDRRSQRRPRDDVLPQPDPPAHFSSATAAVTTWSRRPSAISAAAPLPSHIVDISKPPLGFEGDQAIAVLPFRNMTGDEANDYFAEGVSEDLIVGLSRLRWLPVISRNSSFSFADNVDRKVIGQRLGAKYLLEGGLLRAHDTYAVSASLSLASTGVAMWAKRFSLQWPSTQDGIEQFVTELVAHLESQIEHAEQTQTRRKRQDGLDAHDLIWRGRWHLNRLTRTDAEMAEKLFAEALAHDPDSVEALIQTVIALGWSIWAGRQPHDQILRMRKLAQQAIYADPEDGRGFMLCGIAEMWLRNPLGANNLLRQAIALNPSLSLAHAQLGGSYNLAGDPEQAIKHLGAALRLSSNDPQSFYTLGELAMAYTLLGQWVRAIDHAGIALSRRPAYWYVRVIRINALARSGNIAGARVAFEELMEVKPNFSRHYIEWLPFIDRSWIDHFVEGLKMAAGRQTAWLAPGNQPGSGQLISI